MRLRIPFYHIKKNLADAIAQVLIDECNHFAQQIVDIVEGVDFKAERFPGFPFLIIFLEPVKGFFLFSHHFAELLLNLLQGLVACGKDFSVGVIHNYISCRQKVCSLWQIYEKIAQAFILSYIY